LTETVNWCLTYTKTVNTVPIRFSSIWDRAMVNHKAKLAMSRAWKLAREGQTIYGGSVRSFLAEALRIVWSELSQSPVMRAAASILADYRSGKLKPSHAPAYCVRNRGSASTARWWAQQGART